MSFSAGKIIWRTIQILSLSTAAAGLLTWAGSFAAMTRPPYEMPWDTFTLGLGLIIASMTFWFPMKTVANQEPLRNAALRIAKTLALLMMLTGAALWIAFVLLFLLTSPEDPFFIHLPWMWALGGGIMAAIGLGTTHWVDFEKHLQDNASQSTTEKTGSRPKNSAPSDPDTEPKPKDTHEEDT
ncbi:MAG: hypothetical protein HYU39_04660 [Thaumarchaeota archaeon]|nr:hypothetical protein [Nitrososphaerota archaeon]